MGNSEYFLSVAVKLGGCQILQPTPLLPSRLGNTKVIRAELGALFSPDSVVGYLFFNRKAGVILSVVVREPGTCKLQNCGVSAQKTKTKLHHAGELPSLQR